MCVSVRSGQMPGTEETAFERPALISHSSQEESVSPHAGPHEEAPWLVRGRRTEGRCRQEPLLVSGGKHVGGQDPSRAGSNNRG